MKTIISAITLLVTFSALASGTLEHGSKFKATSFEGRVNMQCPDQMQSYNCRRVQLSPSSFSHFISDNNEADEVILISTQANGKTREKSSRMKSGKSTKSFNLFVETLLQRPLLSIGTNNIQYSLKNEGSVIEGGDFSVEVQKGAPQICATINVMGRSGDCTSIAMACALYFDRTTCRNK